MNRVMCYFCPNFKELFMYLRLCGADQLPEILEIFNHAIRTSTALYDYSERTMGDMENWYADKQAHNHPVMGVFDEDGTLMGFATYGMFRVRPAYKYTVEHSVYVHPEKRGNGLGKMLLKEIICLAISQNYHVMVGVIDADNEVSRRLHEQEGFVLTGIMTEVGYKFGKWLDAAFYQLTLPSPQCPVEG